MSILFIPSDQLLIEFPFISFPIHGASRRHMLPDQHVLRDELQVSVRRLVELLFRLLTCTARIWLPYIPWWRYKVAEIPFRTSSYGKETSKCHRPRPSQGHRDLPLPVSCLGLRFCFGPSQIYDRWISAGFAIQYHAYLGHKNSTSTRAQHL